MPGRKLPHGELEGLVMDVLWDSAEPLTPAAVRERLEPARPLAYTTVMTILVRLVDKGLVTRSQIGRPTPTGPAGAARSRRRSA